MSLTRPVSTSFFPEALTCENVGHLGSIGHNFPLPKSGFEVSRIQAWKPQGAGQELQEGNLGLVLLHSTGSSSSIIP